MCKFIIFPLNFRIIFTLPSVLTHASILDFNNFNLFERSRNKSLKMYIFIQIIFFATSNKYIVQKKLVNYYYFRNRVRFKFVNDYIICFGEFEYLFKKNYKYLFIIALLKINYMG
jgi:hypothetical protein